MTVCFRVGGRKVVGSSATTAESANGASRAFNNPAYIWRTSNREVVAVGAERLPRALDARASAGRPRVARARTNGASERARARAHMHMPPRICIYGHNTRGEVSARARGTPWHRVKIRVDEIHASYVAFLGSAFAFIFPEIGRRLVAAAR